MSVSYDIFSDAFLDKILEFGFPDAPTEADQTVDGYMKRAFTQFRKNCKYDFFTTADDNIREYNVTVNPEDIDELADIVSEGMIVQWLKPYVYRQDNLESILNTKDFSGYSPAELLKQIKDTHKEAKKAYSNMIKSYSYSRGDLTVLSL